MDTQIEPHAFENLGGVPRTPDKRDHIILGAAGAYDFPATKAKPVGRPYYFQGHRPACGAHAGTAMKSALDMRDGVTDVNYTPRQTWIEIKQDGSDPSAGTTMDRIFAVLQSKGSVPFEPLENNVTYGDSDYAASKFLTNQTGRTITSYAYPQDKSFEGIKQGINDFGGVLLLIDVCARFWTAADGRISWAASDILPLAPPSAQFPKVSAHFMWADYYDENYIYGANSFGQTWGLNGDFQMGRDYMPHVTEIGVAHNPVQAPVAPTAVQTVKDSIPQVQTAINQLKTLQPDIKAEHVNLIQQLINDLTALLKGHQ